MTILSHGDVSSTMTNWFSVFPVVSDVSLDRTSGVAMGVGSAETPNAVAPVLRLTCIAVASAGARFTNLFCTLVGGVGVVAKGPTGFAPELDPARWCVSTCAGIVGLVGSS